MENVPIQLHGHIHAYQTMNNNLKIDICEDRNMENGKVFNMKFSKVYPLLIAKAERKGRKKEEVDMITPVSYTHLDVYKRQIPISSLCTVFAESEVINYIGEGKKREDIAAGVVDSVASKVAQLCQRKNLPEEVILTGGLSDSEYFTEAVSYTHLDVYKRQGLISIRKNIFFANS